MIAMGYVTRKHIFHIKTVKVLPEIVPEYLQHSAERSRFHKTERMSVEGYGIAYFQRDGGRKVLGAETHIRNPLPAPNSHK